MDNFEIKKRILRCLSNRHIWGAKHTSIDNLHKGFPSDTKGQAKEVAKELIKEEFLLSKPTSYGLEVSLNPRKKEEIYTLLEV